MLSVILPVRNGIPHIHAAIDSILQQSWTDFELIIVDNCSTDTTNTTIRAFCDQRIKVLLETRLGGPVAFNAGLRLARGNYIARMDADDIAHPDRFHHQIDFLNRHRDISILGTQAIKIDDTGKTVGRSIVPQTPIAIRQSSRYAAPFVHPTLMFRREVWDKLGGYREFSPGADYDMLLRAMETGFRVANLPEFLLKYRILPDSVSHKNRQHTIIHAIAVKRMSLLRRRGCYSREQVILDQLLHHDIPKSTWFSTLDKYVNRLTWYRNRCKIKSSVDLRIFFANVLIASISSLHPHMANALWSALRLKMILFRYRHSKHSR